MPITKNLYEALPALRSNLQQDTLLWVDAICINQRDLGEREAQVAIMRGVYKEASTVRIWLGKEGKSTRQCFETFEIASRRAADPERVPDNVYDMYQIMEACLDLSRRPSWRRIWVVQEATLARSHVVHCGPLHLDFRSLLHWMHAFVGFQFKKPSPLAGVQHWLSRGRLVLGLSSMTLL